jgi:hypothetical protein
MVASLSNISAKKLGFQRTSDHAAPTSLRRSRGKQRQRKGEGD